MIINGNNFYSWGFSSVGRAPALQAGCQRFESANLHCEKELEKYLAPKLGTVVYSLEC
jgi:hypothetical protein